MLVFLAKTVRETVKESLCPQRSVTSAFAPHAYIARAKDLACFGSSVGQLLHACREAESRR